MEPELPQRPKPAKCRSLSPGCSQHPPLPQAALCCCSLCEMQKDTRHTATSPHIDTSIVSIRSGSLLTRQGMSPESNYCYREMSASKECRKGPNPPALGAYLCAGNSCVYGKGYFSQANNVNPHQASQNFSFHLQYYVFYMINFEARLLCMNDTVSIIFFHMQRHFVLISCGMSQLLFEATGVLPVTFPEPG